MTPEAALMKLAYILGKREWGQYNQRKEVRMFLHSELDKTVCPGSGYTHKSTVCNIISQMQFSINFKMLELNLRGEMKVATQRDSSFLKDLSLVGKLADAMKLSSAEVTRPNLFYRPSTKLRESKVFSCPSVCPPVCKDPLAMMHLT